MLLTITTDHQPAAHLGYLVHKHPGRCQCAELSFGRVHVFFPVATEAVCTMAILLEIDPIEMARGRHRQPGGLPLEAYINDRPYVASSFLSVAIAQVLGSAMKGDCREVPGLAETEMPLHAKIVVLPCRGGDQILHRLFEPLGYQVSAIRHPLDEKFPEWGQSPYYTVDLVKRTRLSELLTHLYVLVPVLDNQKHYFIGKEEVEKLLRKGAGWLKDHPEREMIARRYLKNRSSLAEEALTRLNEDCPPGEERPGFGQAEPEENVEKLLHLNEARMGSVLAVLKSAGARRVLDLGCGDGKLLAAILKDRQFEKITGMDVSVRSLEIAGRRLRLADLAPKQRERIELIHGSLMYRDRRLEGYGAATVTEVVEHLDPPRLAAFERVVFEF
ncbi:MAG TPA: 3' terminal RNA ribose 2'-O-methyltransferase Hen1 [Sedimentisphaerales bacterium]|jgi:3' terminal RNA ribose 2'-O-methyltransferase Hen1|nr:3' terminal RNA ribose 2'-O-methyltransferase Hen1 [Sedimentisphaerales bacterium]HNU30466.1 3' terminal RNA ribose 2'-O-methyltransferase Hen1 [Sedimentisphaerales bacterium]